MESGSCDSKEFFMEWEEAAGYGRIYVEEVGCAGGGNENVGDCLRAKTTEEITEGLKRAYERTDVKLPVFAPKYGFGPVIDGMTTGLPEMPLTSIQNGRHNKVPLIIGANHDEGSVFIPSIPTVVNGTSIPLQPSDLPIVIHHFFDRQMDHDTVSQIITNDILRLYPINANGPLSTTNDQFNAIMRDYFFLCPSRRAARAMISSQQPSSDVYMYFFTYTNEWIDSQIFGTYHTFELSFLWSGPEAHPQRSQRRSDTADREMEDIFKQYWTTMARLGTPNDDKDDVVGLRSVVEWPSFSNGTEEIMNLTIPLGIFSGLEIKDRCDMWDDILEDANNMVTAIN